MGVWITIAPGNYTGDVQADFVCRGHDECVLQATIDKAVADDKNVFLLNGVYHMDAFRDVYGDGGPLTTLCVPNTWREIKIVGENSEYGFQKDYRNGVVLYRSKRGTGERPRRKGRLTGAVDGCRDSNPQPRPQNRLHDGGAPALLPAVRRTDLRPDARQNGAAH